MKRFVLVGVLGLTSATMLISCSSLGPNSASSVGSGARLGMQVKFEGLSEGKQAEARAKGYAEGDLVPVVMEQSGNLRIVELKTRKAVAASGYLETVVKFENLTPEGQEKAREKGYAEGDEIPVVLEVQTGEVKVLEPKKD